MSVSVDTNISLVAQPSAVNSFPSANITVEDTNAATWSKIDTGSLALVASPDASLMPAGWSKAYQVYIKTSGRVNVKLTPVGGSEFTIPVQNVLLIRDTATGFSAVKVNGSGDAEVVLLGE